MNLENVMVVFLGNYFECDLDFGIFVFCWLKYWMKIFDDMVDWIM